jgi:hypothetical protein
MTSLCDCDINNHPFFATDQTSSLEVLAIRSHRKVAQRAGGMQQAFCLRLITHPVEHHVQVRLKKDRHVAS